MYQYS